LWHACAPAERRRRAERAECGGVGRSRSRGRGGARPAGPGGVVLLLGVLLGWVATPAVRVCRRRCCRAPGVLTACACCEPAVSAPDVARATARRAGCPPCFVDPNQGLPAEPTADDSRRSAFMRLRSFTASAFWRAWSVGVSPARRCASRTPRTGLRQLSTWPKGWAGAAQRGMAAFSERLLRATGRPRGGSGSTRRRRRRAPQLKNGAVLLARRQPGNVSLAQPLRGAQPHRAAGPHLRAVHVHLRLAAGARDAVLRDARRAACRCARSERAERVNALILATHCPCGFQE
jgi:hypothetical protein